jgi:hypothetical protein
MTEDQGAAILHAIAMLGREVHERFFEVERRMDETARRVDQVREWVLHGPGNPRSAGSSGSSGAWGPSGGGNSPPRGPYR